MAVIGLGIYKLDPQLVVLFGRLRGCGLTGGSKSLGVGLEIMQSHPISYLLPTALLCVYIHRCGWSLSFWLLLHS